MHKSVHDLKFSFLLVTEEKPRKISIVVCKYFENHPEKQLNKMSLKEQIKKIVELTKEKTDPEIFLGRNLKSLFKYLSKN